MIWREFIFISCLLIFLAVRSFTLSQLFIYFYLTMVKYAINKQIWGKFTLNMSKKKLKCRTAAWCMHAVKNQLWFLLHKLVGWGSLMWHRFRDNFGFTKTPKKMSLENFTQNFARNPKIMFLTFFLKIRQIMALHGSSESILRKVFVVVLKK